jgi:hypothetical protein
MPTVEIVGRFHRREEKAKPRCPLDQPLPKGARAIVDRRSHSPTLSLAQRRSSTERGWVIISTNDDHS